MPIKRPLLTAEARPVEVAFLLDEEQPDSLELILLEDGLIGRGDRRATRACALWEKHREALLARFIRTQPGRRPRCWWQFDAPGLRAVVVGSATPLPALGFRYGVPRHLDDWTPGELAYESQATFLKRHRLLLPSERRRLRAADYAPEPFHHWIDDTDEILRASETAVRE